MPAKKAASKSAQSSGMGMGSVWAWVYVIATVVAAVLGGLAFKNDIVTWLLILAAVLVGLFYFDPEELGQFGLRVVVLFVAKEGLSAVPAIGGFFSGFFNGWLAFLYPVVLAMALRFFWEKRIAPLF
jgi:hypothetical protein